jgi:hypothetical protein
MKLNGPAVIKAEKESVAALLAGDRGPGVVLKIVADAHGHADWLTDGAKTMMPPGPIACRVGCTYCCHLRVITTIPEVLRIAEYVRTKLGDQAVAAVRERISEHAVATAGLDAEARRRLRLPCSLLKDGLCSAYEVRPLSCRGWNSVDLSGCEADFREPAAGVRVPIYEGQYLVNAYVQAGVVDGLRTGDVQADRVELQEALGVALEKTDAAERWLQGERVFEAARD